MNKTFNKLIRNSNNFNISNHFYINYNILFNNKIFPQFCYYKGFIKKFVREKTNDIQNNF